MEILLFVANGESLAGAISLLYGYKKSKNINDSNKERARILQNIKNKKKPANKLPAMMIKDNQLKISSHT